METEVSENSTLLIPIVFDRQAGFSLAITHFQSIIRGLFFFQVCLALTLWSTAFLEKKILLSGRVLHKEAIR